MAEGKPYAKHKIQKAKRKKNGNFEYIKNFKQLTNNDKNNKVQNQATDWHLEFINNFCKLNKK